MMSFFGGNIGGFLSVFSSSSINKADFHDITELDIPLPMQPVPVTAKVPSFC